MKQYIIDRVLEEARLIIDTNGTIRKVAKLLNEGKSTVYIDLAVRLKEIDLELYTQVRKILDRNKELRYSRGGQAFKEKMLREKQGGKGHEK